jgi:hypothetical protein
MAEDYELLDALEVESSSSEEVNAVTNDVY